MKEGHKSRITRKPGANAPYKRPARRSIDFEQLESRIDSIRMELKCEIKSVEKRKI